MSQTASTPEDMPEYDIVIIGGGMVGASFAAALLHTVPENDLRIAIVEAAPFPVAAPNASFAGAGSKEASADEQAYQPSFDARATALSYGAKNIYESMGVWQKLRQGVAPINTIHISDRGHFGAARLHAANEGVDALGYVIENRWLGQNLIAHLQSHGADKVDWYSPAEVVALSQTETHSTVSLKATGESELPACLSAQLVVMADGGRSALRETLGIHYAQDDYQQFAVIANISPDRDHQGIAYERFTDTGPMALLPLTAHTLSTQALTTQTLATHDRTHRCGLVWTVAAEEHEDIMGLSDTEFLARVQARFGYRAGQFIKVGERASYPLKLTQAKEQVRQGLVVLGNAAHALHPIAGQGYNLALRGATALAEHIAQMSAQGEAIGSLSHLQRFYDAQREDQTRTIHASDRLMKLFSTKSSLLALGRDMGLQALDVCPSAKTIIARAAMGIDLPAPNLRPNLQPNTRPSRN